MININKKQNSRENGHRRTSQSYEASYSKITYLNIS